MKLKPINILIASTLLLLSVGIFGYYLLNYPQDFDVLEIIKWNVNWVTITYLSLVVISVFCKYFILKKNLLLNVFLILVSISNFVLIFIASFQSVNAFREHNREFKQILAVFRNDAQNDVKNDDVKKLGFGLPLPPQNTSQELELRKNDSVLKIYGLTRKNLGCVISPTMVKVSQEYEKLIADYLSERNGKNWQFKMDKEIRKVNSH